MEMLNDQVLIRISEIEAEGGKVGPMNSQGLMRISLKDGKEGFCDVEGLLRGYLPTSKPTQLW